MNFTESVSVGGVSYGLSKYVLPQIQQLNYPRNVVIGANEKDASMLVSGANTVGSVLGNIFHEYIFPHVDGNEKSSSLNASVVLATHSALQTLSSVGLLYAYGGEQAVRSVGLPNLALNSTLSFVGGSKVAEVVRPLLMK